MSTHDLVDPTTEKKSGELTRREFIDRAKKAGIYAVPAVTILAASEQAIANSGGE